MSRLSIRQQAYQRRLLQRNPKSSVGAARRRVQSRQPRGVDDLGPTKLLQQARGQVGLNGGKVHAIEDFPPDPAPSRLRDAAALEGVFGLLALLSQLRVAADNVAYPA